MTTVFEVRFTSVADFLDELRRDHEHDGIAGRIVRLAVRSGTATINMVEGTRTIPGERSLPTMRSRYVEASYVSSRQQLVKLSSFCGIEYIELDGLEALEARLDSSAAGLEARERERADTTGLRVREVLAGLQATMYELAGLEVRGGGLFVEEGAWVAHPDEAIEVPTAETCATCHEGIYYANKAWRHQTSRQAEVYDSHPCRGCQGSGELRGRICGRCNGLKVQKGLHHLADPEEEGRNH